jgi:hypothetical protein
MPYKGEDFQWTRDEAAADITQGRYGEENDDKIAELVNFENGVRKLWADRLRETAEVCPQDERAGMLRAADLLDPYTTKHPVKAAGYVRTRLDDRPEGAVWFGPETGSGAR